MRVVSPPDETLVLQYRQGDTRIVPITGAYYGTLYPKRTRTPRLCIRWGIAGEYLFDLEKNSLTRAPGWHAADIEEAWRTWGRIISLTPGRLANVRGRDIVADLKKAGVPIPETRRAANPRR